MRQRRKPTHSSSFDQKKPRTNERIRAPEVLLVDDEGNTEVLAVADALQRAQDEELDLIEVSPKAKPPVVKIGDFGQYLYQIKKRSKKRIQSKQR